MNRLNAYLRTLSLRAWIATGMGMALIPLILFGVVSFFSYHKSIAKPFREVLNAQHRVLMPTERISDELWQLSSDVNFFVRGGAQSYRDRFMITESRVERHLEDLKEAISLQVAFQPILDEVEAQWALLVSTAAQVAPGEALNEDPVLVEFEQDTVNFARSLSGVVDRLRSLQEEEHQRMLKVMRRIEVTAAIAGIISLVLIAISVDLIDKALIRSTDQLVAGAMRVAKGDRESAIEVQVPPELAAVAHAFNAMTRQIVQQENALSALAGTDGLTGVANRREFDRALAEMVRRADAGGEGFALMMIDIDHFKSFNDTHGHIAGDDTLRQVTSALVLAARPTDRLFRYGGEEFAVIIGDIQDAQVETVAEHLRASVEDHKVVLAAGVSVNVTISAGVVVHRPEMKAQDLVLLADAALYRAKRAGRNMVMFAS